MRGETGRSRKPRLADGEYAALGPEIYAPVYKPPQIRKWPPGVDFKNETLFIRD